MPLAKFKTVTAALLVVGLAAFGGGLPTHEHVIAQQAKPGQQNEKTPGPQEEQALAKPATDRYGDPLPAGALARQGSARLTQGGAVASLAFSPDGKIVASCSSPASCEERTIHLWEVATGREVASILADGHVSHLSFSPDGKLIASAGEDTALRLWDVATRKERCRCGDKDQSVSDMAFSPESKLLAAISSERDGHFVTLWDTAAGKKVRSWKANEKKFMWSIAFAPDGATLATAGAENLLHIWDVAKGTERNRIDVDQAGRQLAFSPDGKVVALANGNHTIRRWEPATGRELPPLRGHKGHIERLAFSEGGKTLVSASVDRTIRYWDTATAKELRRISVDTSDSWVMAFSPDQKVLAVGGFSSTIRLFDTATGNLLHPRDGHTGRVAAVGFLPRGDMVASVAGERVLRLAETATGKEQHHSKLRPGYWISIPLFPNQKYGGYLQFSHVALSRDSSLVAVPGREKENGESTVGIWDVASDRAVGSLTSKFGSFSSLAFSPDKKTLALACYDKTIRVWDIAARNIVRRLTGHEGDTLTLDFSPDGKLLASACSDRTARVWDLATGKEVYQLKHGGRVHAVAFSPDGRSLASAGGEHLRENKGDNRVHVWELATGQERALLRGNHHFVTCLAFAPSGHVLALGSSDASVRVWDPLASKELRRFEGHRGVVSSVAFSPDGKRLASGNSDTTVLIWDTAGLVSTSLPAAALKAEECEALWIDLAGADAGRAYRAVGTLAAHAGQTLPFLAKHLAPAKSPDRKKSLAALIDDLDSDAFAVREKAAKELQRMREEAGPALQKAIDQPRSLESRRRMEGLLARLRRPIVASELLQPIRAIEVLERIDSHESRKLLRTLAEGAPEAWLTEDARKTLARMENR
jgi:WD40 repeat protein